MNDDDVDDDGWFVSVNAAAMPNAQSNLIFFFSDFLSLALPIGRVCPPPILI